MNWDWDLSYLYQSFEDPAFAADLAALPELNAQLAEAIKTELPAKEKLEKLVKLDTLHDLAEEAAFIRDVLIPGMGELRAAADEAETRTAATYWPFPTYGDLLFGVK